MKKADLHTHTKFSDHPSEWFLQRLGAKESYTEPEEQYKQAKESGMDFVVITDHNKIDGALELKQKHPNDVIVGIESTAYFPEDNCKIHILFYGITEQQFTEIEKLRKNIYELRDYAISENLAYSVAHAVYSVNNKLTQEHIEKLILLFNTFEGINGARDATSNNTWIRILRNLTPSIITRLYEKHRILPVGSKPWVKGITGGSDDHACLFTGRTYTECSANTMEEFLDAIKNNSISAGGRHNDYFSFVFTLYKIAYDFSRSNKTSFSKNFFNQLSDFIFNEKGLSISDKIKLKYFEKESKKKKDKITTLFADLIKDLNSNILMPIEKKFEMLYLKTSAVTDELLRVFLKSLEKNLLEGNIPEIIKSISSSLPGVFITMPFFTSLKHFNQTRSILESLCESLDVRRPSPSKKILWFTDTLNDLNGVSNTLKTMGWQSHLMRKEFCIVTSLTDAENTSEIPPNIINLPAIHSFTLPYYEKYKLKLPSILFSIKKICDFAPDEIYISTPGPIGLLGLIASKVLNVKSTGIYHTDFTSQINKIINDEQLESLVEAGIKWFYSSMNEIKVPSFEYIKILKKRGYDASSMSIFKRGIDSDFFSFQSYARQDFNKSYGINDGFTLLYTGRISKDKNLDFLMGIYKLLSQFRKDINFVLVGDGPYLKELKKSFESNSRVIFTGMQKQNVMPMIYSSADIFLFPSTTDTFGMSVLEAQSCKLPAIVSDIGGPKEIILNNKTGFICSLSITEWKLKIEFMLALCEFNPLRWEEMRTAARENAVLHYNWKKVIEEISSFKSPPPTHQPKFSHI